MNPGSTTLTLSKKASCVANNADVIFFANSFGFIFNSEEIIKAKLVEKSPCEIFFGIDKDNLEKQEMYCNILEQIISEKEIILNKYIQNITSSY